MLCGRALLSLLSLSLLGGCYAISPSKGGGQTPVAPQLPKQPEDVALPAGYAISVVTTGLNFPTGVAFDDDGTPYVVEAGYSYGERFTTPRLLRIGVGGEKQVLATGDQNGPWNGVAFGEGALFVAEGGELHGGRILRFDLDGKMTVLADNLPSVGDHHTDGPAVGMDGNVYFGQGTATNSGVVGPDNAEYGWLRRHPDFHDIPCKDVKLRGTNYSSRNALTGTAEVAVTGAYSPYGTPTQPGQIIPGKIPCSGAIMRVPAKGGPIELVAWGLRNPYGLAFSPDHKLFVTENGFDERGSRPVYGVGDLLWEITPGAWYGWPDFGQGQPVYTRRFKPPGKDIPLALLQENPATPPKPVALFGVHSSANGFDFATNPAFGYAGNAFVALFGDMVPETGKVLGPVGFKVVRVDVNSGVMDDFATNRGKEPGPASKQRSGGLERPIAVRFDPTGTALYVVDFGVLNMTDKGPVPQEGTGVLWKITRGGAR
jgi:glucose/arabinose dehydrogenase